jgi:hypothetical protein
MAADDELVLMMCEEKKSQTFFGQAPGPQLEFLATPLFIIHTTVTFSQ